MYSWDYQSEAVLPSNETTERRSPTQTTSFKQSNVIISGLVWSVGLQKTKSYESYKNRVCCVRQAAAIG